MAAGACGMAALLALLPAAGHDQLWFLLMAERWMGGGCGRGVLYGPTAFDSNTPAIVWLSSLPVLLAHLLKTDVAFTGKLLFTLLEALVATAAYPLLPPRVRCGPAVFFLFVTLFAVLPARDFGQRDLAVVLLALPYLLLSAQREAEAQRASLRSRLCAAFLLALGVCLKPQLALIPFAVELLLFARGKRRPEPLVFLATGGVFLLAIWLFAPLYFTSALPITRATYWAIGHLSPAELFVQAVELHVLLFALAVFLFVCLVRRRSLLPTTPVLLGAGLGALVAYYVQGTGWYYQQLPAILLFAGAGALELVASLPSGRSLRVSAAWPVAAGSLSLLAILLTFHFSGYQFSGYPFTPDRTYAISTPSPSFFRTLAPDTPVATLTTSVDDSVMPVFRYHLILAQRTNNLWTLPAILRAGARPNRHLPPARLAALAAQQKRWMVEDLERWHPQLILVERCQDPTVHCQTLEGMHPDLLAFFAPDPAFARIFARYRFSRSQGPYDAYVAVR